MTMTRRNTNGPSRGGARCWYKDEQEENEESVLVAGDSGNHMRLEDDKEGN